MYTSMIVQWTASSHSLKPTEQVRCCIVEVRSFRRFDVFPTTGKPSAGISLKGLDQLMTDRLDYFLIRT